MTGIVIIGAGHGGVQAAASLREHGYTKPVTLISADSDFPYHKPPLSKTFLKSPDAELQPLRGHSFFTTKDIRLLPGVAATAINRVDRFVTLSDGNTVDYDNLILATGTVPRRLEMPGKDLAGVFYLRSGTDARALRNRIGTAKRAVIIGGGFIGLEVAAMMATNGIAVTVIELASRILARVSSAPVAAVINDELIEAGVNLRIETGINHLQGENGNVCAVVLPHREILPCDLVLVGIGAVPDIALATASGLECENGISVNGGLATSDPHIFAIGDCCNFPEAGTGNRIRLESVQNATDQARVVASILTGTDIEYSAVPWFWSDIGSIKLQITGLSAGCDLTVPVFGGSDSRVRSVYHYQGDKLRAVETLNSPAEHMLARRLLASGRSPSVEMVSGGDIGALRALL